LLDCRAEKCGVETPVRRREFVTPHFEAAAFAKNNNLKSLLL